MTKRNDKVTVTITVDRDVAEVLDALAFVHGFSGRAAMLRATMTDMARTQYAREPTIRELVDTKRALHAPDGVYSHLRVVR